MSDTPIRNASAAPASAGRRLSRRSLALKVAGAAAAVTAARLLPVTAGRPPVRTSAAQTASSDAVYTLPGPQVEPEASFWTVAPLPLPGVPRIEELAARTDNPGDPAYFPPYPSDAAIAAEIEELIELARLRDDPDAIAARTAGRERAPLSSFLQLRPQPLSAVYNKLRQESGPVVTTGRELARYFENETPGLVHRMALEHLLRDQNWSPVRQARMWMALDLAIYSALLAAWHYKWFSERPRVGYRPRPVELDARVSVLYDRALDRNGAVERATRVFPSPAPGTPRHPAYPSGHSTVGGAGSELLAYFFPDARTELDRLADNCGMARLWAGIHYRSDHEQGIALGRTTARAVIAQLDAGCVVPARTLCTIAPGVERPLVQNQGLQAGSGGSGTFCDAPPTREQLHQMAADVGRCAARGGN